MQRLLRAGIAAVYTLFVIGTMGIVSPALADNYKFGASKAGGAWYPIGVAIQRLVEKQFGDKLTIDIGGGLANAINTMNGKIDMGMTFASTVQDAMQGIGAFKGKANAADLRIASVQYSQMMFWVVWADSGITHWSQLKGKRVNAMPKRFSAHALNKQMLQGLGMSLKSFSKVVYLGFNDAVVQMKDGHIDAYLGPGERQYAPIIQLAAHKPIRILQFSNEDIKKMQNVQQALVPVTVDKKYYDQPADVQVIQSYQIIVTNKNVSEERVYRVAKAMYDNLDYMRTVNPNFKRVTPESALVDLGIKKHPGLVKYLKEKGLM